MEENYSTWRQLKSFKGVEFNNLGEYRNKKTGLPIKKRAYWRPIKGYPDYSISNFGDICSEKFNKEKILKQTKGNHGYYFVTLSKNKILKVLLVHRLVAENFIENKYKKPQVNHIDGNKLNNKVTNLEWVTAKQNNQHAWDTGLRENARKSIKIMIESIKKPIYSSKLDLKFDSCTEAATYIQENYFKNTNLMTIQSSISLLLLNKNRKSKYDFGWRNV